MERYSSLVPLFLFTSFLSIAISIVIGVSLIAIFLPESMDQISFLLLWALVFTFAGGISAGLHVGNIRAGILTWRNFLHSPLSQEIVLSTAFGFILSVTIVSILILGIETGVLILLGLGCLCGILVMISIGQVYNLPRQITWRGSVSSLGLLVHTLLMASIIALLINPEMVVWFHTIMLRACYILVSLELLILIYRLRGFIRLQNKSDLLVFPQFIPLILINYMLMIGFLIVIFALFLSDLPRFVLVIQIILLILDRITFYASVAPQSPKSIVAIAKKERMKNALL